MPGHEEKALSILVQWSQASGLNDHRSFPSTQLRRHVGATEWARREKEFDNTDGLEAFAARKVRDLNKYDTALEKMEDEKALVDSGQMTKERFVASALRKLQNLPHSSVSMVNDEMDDDRFLRKVATWLRLRLAELRQPTSI